MLKFLFSEYIKKGFCKALDMRLPVPLDKYELMAKEFITLTETFFKHYFVFHNIFLENSDNCLKLPFWNLAYVRLGIVLKNMCRWPILRGNRKNGKRWKNCMDK